MGKEIRIDTSKKPAYETIVEGQVMSVEEISRRYEVSEQELHIEKENAESLGNEMNYKNEVKKIKEALTMSKLIDEYAKELEEAAIKKAHEKVKNDIRKYIEEGMSPQEIFEKLNEY